MAWGGGPPLYFWAKWRPSSGPSKNFFRLGPTLISKGPNEQAPHVLNELNPPLQGSYINIVSNCLKYSCVVISVSLFVGNLSFDTNEETLQGFFEDNALSPTSTRIAYSNGSSRG